MPRKVASRLDEYGAKRDFERTREPKGRVGKGSAEPTFVIQEHHARRLHWDFRLERDGVLVSWALPKGVPADPRRNHLAVQVEDHPLEYGSFEGEIPAGEYGGGQVSIWDRGTYETEKWEPDEVKVILHGERVQGRHVLFRTSGQNWMIHRMDPPQDAAAVNLPRGLKPMLATLSTLPLQQEKYAFEFKWDGFRALAYVDGGRVVLESRNQLDITAMFPEVSGLGRQLGSRSALLDGELVALDEHGRPSFQRLQQRAGLRSKSTVRTTMEAVPVVYMVFDLLHLEGRDLMPLPYVERRRLLESLDLGGESWQVPFYRAGEGDAMLRASRDQEQEGIVAKRLDSPYTPGRRSDAWLKVKNQGRQELVIGGWTEGAGSRRGTLGALLVGVQEDGRLRYSGKVGTGFDRRALAELDKLLTPLATGSSPFASGTPPRGAHWVEPSLVCEVEFTEWTREGTLRHPSFKGLRPDKPAAEVVREKPRELPASPEPEPERPTRARRGQKPDPPPEPRRAARKGGAKSSSRAATEVQVEGRTLALTNLDKVLYPETGFTKGEVIDYYSRVAPILLSHLVARPITLKRYPEGVEGQFFYEKNCAKHRPEWVRTVAVPRRQRGAVGETNHCLVEDLPSLVWAANLASIELHVSLHSRPHLDRPHSIVFDLDPGPPADEIQCAQVAIWCRDWLKQRGLRSWIKTSGSKGLQLYVPINQPITYAETKPFANELARALERDHPELVTSAMSRSLRTGKVFVDWSQNDDKKTTVSVYSLRARAQPTVSTPVEWAEVEAALEAGDPSRLRFTSDAVLDRIQKMGDLFAPLLTTVQELPSRAV